MDPLPVLASLFPAVFMLHDFEEIIFVEGWLRQNREMLAARFPRLARHLLPYFATLTTASFSVAVAEEFVFVTLVTHVAVWGDDYRWWLAGFMAFSLHLFSHLGQSLALRRYTPGVVTAVLALPYAGVTFWSFWQTGRMSAAEIVGWTVGGLLAMVVNLALAHWLGRQLWVRTRNAP